MSLNELIAQGAQFKAPDLLGQYATMQNLQQGMQQNALNTMKMDEMRRTSDEHNQLRNVYAGITDYNDPSIINRIGAVSPANAVAMMKTQREALESKSKLTKENADAVAVALKNSQTQLATVTEPGQYMQWFAGNFKDPVLSEYLKSRGVDPDQSMRQITADIQAGKFPDLLRRSALGAEKALENHLTTLNNGQTQSLVSTPKYGQGAPTTLLTQQMQMPPGAAEANETARGNLRVKEGELKIKQDAAANKVSVADTKKQEATGQLDDIVASLNAQYDALEKGGGIVSTDKGTLSNLAASAEASGLGQYVGKALGTQNQSARNQIGMTRPQLLMAIKNASGMTAKQLDSNADLKLWLQAATDPQLDVQANRAALNNIVNFIGKRAGATPAATAPPQGKPANTTVVDAYTAWKAKQGGQ